MTDYLASVNAAFQTIFAGDKPMRNEAPATNPRPLHVIAQDIYTNWPTMPRYASEYASAMRHLHSIEDKYYADDARTVVAYFLANAMTWRGEHARRIKAELNAMLGR